MLICYHHDANNGKGEISQLPVLLNELFTFLFITLIQFQLSQNPLPYYEQKNWKQFSVFNQLPKSLTFIFRAV